MKKILVYVVILIISIMFWSCNGSGNSSRQRLLTGSNNNCSYKRKNFDSLMAVIARDNSTGLDFSEELLENKAFLEIFDHSSAYLADVYNLLTKNNPNNLQASICIFSMQNLEIDDYANLCNVYLTLYNEKRISESMLEQAIIPNFLKKNLIAENYNNINVKNLLSKIENDKNISINFKKIIKSILSDNYLT